MSRSSQGFSPGHPLHPTPQYFPYLIPIAIEKNNQRKSGLALMHIKRRNINEKKAEREKETYSYSSLPHMFCYIEPDIIAIKIKSIAQKNELVNEQIKMH